MQFDRNLFGEGIKVYSHGTSSTGQILYDYTIGSQNANLSAAFESGAVENNATLPDNLFYWLIGKDSPYNQISFVHRSGTSPNYNYEIINSEKNNKNIPVVLWGCYTKINPTTYDVDIENGSNLSNSGNNCYLIYDTSTFNLTNSQKPLWEKNFGFNSSPLSNGKYSSLPFILDFDYNNFIFTIKVGSSQGYVDLANYNNTENNYINTIGIELNTGDVSTGNARLARQSRCDINGNSITYTMSANNYPVTDFDYNIPEVYRQNNLYSYEKYRAIAKLGSQTNHILFNGASAFTSYTSVTPSYFMDSDKWELVNNAYRLKKHGEGVYNEDDFNYIRKLIAWFGFWFTDGGLYTDNEHSYTLNRVNCLLGDNANTYAESYMIPDKVYQAEIVNGITTGNFTELRIAKDNDQSKWGKDWRDKNGYNGRDTGKDEKDFGNLSTVLHRGSIAAGCKWYGLNSTQLNGLITWMNSGYQPASNDQFVNDFKGVNPAEYITSITYLPFYPIPSGTDELINVGPLSTAVSGRKIAYEYGVTVDLGSYTLDRYFNDFRDFKPYTAISLYIPFCGTVELDAANYYNRTINVKLMIDMSTGSCTGLVFANDLLIDTISGQCGVKIPLAAFNMGDYQDAIINAQYQLKQAERQRDNAMIGAGIAIVGGAITASTGIGAVAGAAAAIYAVNKMYDARDRIENIEYNIEHMQPKQTNISTGSPTNSLGMEYDARLIITRPTTLDTDINIYGHTVGYMTNKQGILSDFSGFTQCSNVDLSGIPMTSSELASIHEALKSGVYLP